MACTMATQTRNQGNLFLDRCSGPSSKVRLSRVRRSKARGGGSVNLTTQQRTEIRQTVLAGGNVPRVNNVNFAVRVGTTVPTSVRVVEVPPALIEIHPQWRGHMYFVVGDQIIIVDRNNRSSQSSTFDWNKRLKLGAVPDRRPSLFMARVGKRRL